MEGGVIGSAPFDTTTVVAPTSHFNAASTTVTT